MCRGKNLIWAKFSTRLKISGFCQISSFADSEWLKLSILIKILNATKNFWILQNFLLRISLVVRNVSFLTNFQRNSKFPDFAQFQMWELIKMLKFECKMSSQSKCWNLSEKGSWSKCQNLSERGNRWKHWNLKTELGINQNAEIWVLMVKRSKCWNLSEKALINQNVEIWVQI